MSQPAQVLSIAAIGELRAALLNFGEEATAALGEMNLAGQRALDWLADDQTKYWKTQVRRRQDQVAEAKTALARCQHSKVLGQSTSCQEEKVALRAAGRGLRECEEMVEQVRRWQFEVEHATSEYNGRAQPLAAMLDRDIPRAAALLDRMTDALEGYLRVRAQPAARSSDTAAKRPGDATTEMPKTPPDEQRQHEGEVSVTLKPAGKEES